MLKMTNASVGVTTTGEGPGVKVSLPNILATDSVLSAIPMYVTVTRYVIN